MAKQKKKEKVCYHVCDKCGKNEALYIEIIEYYSSSNHTVNRICDGVIISDGEDINDDDTEEQRLCADCVEDTYGINEQNPRPNEE